MIGFEDEYEAIEENGRNAFSSYLSFGEWIFFAFGMEPQSELDKALSKCVPQVPEYKALPWCKGKNQNESLRVFARELLENGEVIFLMSEKYRRTAMT